MVGKLTYVSEQSSPYHRQNKINFIKIITRHRENKTGKAAAEHPTERISGSQGGIGRE
jgi:hypothetical protein